MEEKILLECQTVINQLNSCFNSNMAVSELKITDKVRFLQFVEYDCGNRLSGKLLNFLSVDQKANLGKWANTINPKGMFSLMVSQKLINLLTRETVNNKLKDVSGWKTWTRLNHYDIDILLNSYNGETKENLLKWIFEECSLQQIEFDVANLNSYITTYQPIINKIQNQGVVSLPNSRAARMERRQQKAREHVAVQNTVPSFTSRVTHNITVQNTTPQPSVGGHRITNLSSKKIDTPNTSIKSRVRTWQELQNIVKT